jgi:SAM-dependent methyltransferase
MRATATDSYWDRVAESAQFSLPLDADVLGRFAAPDARILDYGCGYGRQLAELLRLGYRDVAGIDPSLAMVERARRELPGIAVAVCGAPPSEHPSTHPTESFDVVLLSAVLTCVPRDAEQNVILGEIFRVLRPGGILLLADFLLHSDARNRDRYRADRPESLPFGCFEVPGGAVMRHHDPGHILDLTQRFETLQILPFAARTMNGNAATGVSYVGRKPVVGSAETT